MQENEQDNYSFLKQTIKKRPINGKKLALRILGIIAAAVGFGAIAAFVFVAMRPVAENVVYGPEEDPRVTIPADEEPGPVVAISSSSAEVSSETSASASAESSVSASTESSASTGEESTTPASSSGAAGESGAQGAEVEDPETEVLPPELPASGITLEQYRQLHLDMIDAAAQAERAMVQVVGISNELDYFLEGHENRKQAAGLVIAKSGDEIFILTDRAAVQEVEEIFITFSDDSTASASVIRADENTGLVAIRCSAEQLSEELSVELEDVSLGNSFTVVRGEPVLALGSPTGYSDAVAYGVVTSTASRLSGTDGEYRLLTTDIEGGGSGSSGVLVNLKGEIVGFITEKVARQEGGAVSALAISRIKPLIERLSNNEAGVYAGIRGQTVTEDLSEITGIPVGLLVTGVDQDSPAMLAGIKEFDVITAIGDQEILGMDGYSSALSAQTPGQAVRVTAQRQGADGYVEVNFELTAEER